MGRRGEGQRKTFSSSEDRIFFLSEYINFHLSAKFFKSNDLQEKKAVLFFKCLLFETKNYKFENIPFSLTN